ncbi:MAG: transcriptional regulator [Oscillospiraceae bacterium]|nr:transcriptional regulator [Oscillospiraceae bacterium]
MARCSTNKEAWDKLFEQYNILKEISDNGYFRITAKQINEHREARLMTKFDNSAILPEIFKSNELSILPITRGSYIISSFKSYEDFTVSNTEIEKISFPSYIQSLDYTNINSESVAINCAYITKILEKFLDEEELVPTVNGRMGSGNFKFNINKLDNSGVIEVTVENSQLEIDGGYEGIHSLALIEAKNYLSDDFMIRQIYYPYRLWSSKVTKPVRPIYIIYSNGIFNVYEYTFDNPEDYSSVRLVKSKRYSIEDTEIELEEIKTVLNTVNIILEPEIPFPQADKFERVVNLCELLEGKGKTKKYITSNYAFDERQTNYYTDAAKYLGLVEKGRIDGEITFNLTAKGNQILNLPYKNRQLEFTKLILEHKVFKETLDLYLANSEKPSNAQVIDIMKNSNLYNIDSDSTYIRRSSTVKSWIDWILNLIT